MKQKISMHNIFRHIDFIVRYWLINKYQHTPDMNNFANSLWYE